MLRATAILPLACATVAFILSMLVLFAGDSPKILPSVELLRLNTSQVGQGLNLLGDSESSDRGGLGGLFDKGKDALQDVGNDAIDAASSAVTDALDIKDFYSAHLMTFCEGDFKPNAKDPKAEEEVTACSKRKAFYTFDPTEIIESKLPEGLGLSDIKWPDEITNGVRAINMASRAMFFFYLIGIAAAGIGMIGAVFGLLAYEHKVALANLGVNSLGFICLGLASAIATVVIFRATQAVNDFGGDIGLAADRGTAFLGMTWTATILMLLATIGWVGEFMMGRRRSVYKEESYY
ncbi:hypothetical protein EPUS_01818 [Endocarpon pusillum Z07020]|uniref:Actin cortical patch SUR7/pH-response regulator PalI n=1 Tax=Endocarpon pusillum (strain Z07020 / HMAS-L-300199) TaxID=1263415 RepID=U1HKK9_ENDPU|nr:uncharacterized protein EPUS_01818 [Endocarpon pusillum Z07020]ERF69489.1 hypothetical protein EPUS_01818 [Endocarpon pusillum Z07020]